MFGYSNAIYYSLAIDLSKDIIAGKMQAGDKLPTVRELAKLHKVNPQTVQKAYALLESENIVVARVGSGKYVTTDFNTIETLKKDLSKDIIDDFVTKIDEYNLDIETTTKLIKERYEYFKMHSDK